LYGKSFAKETAIAINNESVIGVVPPVNDRFKTTA
jgi:hypothetical protein